MSRCVLSSLYYEAASLYFPDASPQEQQELFVKKLAQCSTVFDFMDPMSDLRGKEIKRATLNELVDYITSERGVLTDAAYPEVVAMVNAIK